MTQNEEQFAAQIRAIVEAGETNDTLEERPLTLSELKELAISMGLNEEQWEALLVKAQKHLKLADDHLKARNYKEAIREGNQAVAINPYLVNCNAILAKAYMMMWLEDHNPETRAKAEYHARKELVVDPRDQQAVMVLNTIQKKSDVLEKDSGARKKMFWLIGGIVLVVVLIAFFLANRFENSAQAEEQAQISAENNRIKDQLIEAEEDVAAKYDLVQVAIDQRNQMIPDLFEALDQAPAEMAILDSAIQSLQVEISTASGEEKFELENSLDTKIDETKRIVQQYADKSAAEKLMVQIEGSENRIAYEKKNYNDAVKNYNILVKKHGDKFPEYELKPYYNEK